MNGLTLAICDRALAPGGDAPEWVHLLHEGHMTGRDGRQFNLSDPEALVIEFQSLGIDLPIDYEHQNDKPEAKLSGPVPAAGWIKELKAAEGGLWGRVEWTETAAEMIRRKEYRFLSPSMLVHPKTRQIVRLKGAGLVHNPNLFLTALASQETAMLPPVQPKDQTKPATDLAAAIAELLGLPVETPPAELLAKLVAHLKAAPDPAKYMPVAAVQEMLSDRRAERKTVHEGRAQEKVNAALRQGYITNGMGDWAIELCTSDEAAFDTFLEKSGPVFAPLFKASHLTGVPPAAHVRYDTPLEAEVCAQLGLKPGSLKD
jgi:phage I-like protein